MNDQTPYTNREIDARFESLSRDIQEGFARMEKHLHDIKSTAQIASAMGTKNEKDIIILNTKLNTTVWAFGITIPLIIGLVSWIFVNELSRLRETIPAEIIAVLKDYEISIIQ